MKISNSAINRVGNIIRQGKTTPGYNDAVSELNAWREAHGPLMDEYFDKCVELASRINKSIIVAQRLKRLPTIVGKLNRFEGMGLSRMQDIAGVRIIVEDMVQLGKVEKEIKKWNNQVRIKDYIKEPKESGYRGKHFIFKKNGMFVEIQLRTQFQHLWATSVETTDIFRGASLKEHSDKTCWHDFFCQVSSIFAITERTPLIDPYKNKNISEICSLLEENMNKNKIGTKIASFALTDPIVDNEKIKGAYYAVMALNFREKVAVVTGYKETEYHLAFEKYQKLEKRNKVGQQVVLIAVNQIKKIREAYPNYFMNLNLFLAVISFMIEKNKKK